MMRLNGGLLSSSIGQAHRWGFARSERMSVRKLLWVSGVLTAIDVAFPQLVGFGMFLLILPGVILALAPTVFIYTGTFAIVRLSPHHPCRRSQFHCGVHHAWPERPRDVADGG